MFNLQYLIKQRSSENISHNSEERKTIEKDKREGVNDVMM